MFTTNQAVISMAVAIGLSGCATVQLPPGQEDARIFVQKSSMPYRDAYRLIAKQMRACYRAITPFGSGIDIQADLDTEKKAGTIELYPVGMAGVRKAEESILSRTVTVVPDGAGSVITTAGNSPTIVYLNHLAIANWLDGGEGCGHKDSNKPAPSAMSAAGE